MDIKNFISNTFSYLPERDYQFDILAKEETKEDNNINNIQKKTNIFPSLSVNIEYIKTLYNTMINSDIVLREFTINARGKQYNAFLLYIDGMIDAINMDQFIISPLMLRNKNNTFDGMQNKIISEAVTNNITVRKVKKFDLSNYIMSCLLPQNSVKEVQTFEDISNAINSGNCGLFIDTLNMAFNIEVKGFKQRSVEKPDNEIVVKGPHEAFVENIRTNTSLIRRIANNENLIIENIEVGKITKTKCAVCYMKNIANDDLVSEVKYRLNNLEIDSLFSVGELEQLIVESNLLGIPQVLSTERPDKVSKYLLSGRVAVLVNGTPYGIIMPAVLVDFLTSSEDTNLKSGFANFLRFLRLLSAFMTLLLPGLYIAITSFYQEILPTSLLYTILAARENVPFPIIVEIFIMEISFELIREACLRVPAPIGPTIRNCWSSCFGTSRCICWYCKSNFNYYCSYYRNCIFCYY